MPVPEGAGILFVYVRVCERGIIVLSLLGRPVDLTEEPIVALKKKSITQLSKEREAEELEKMALKILTKLDALQDEIDVLEEKRKK